MHTGPLLRHDMSHSSCTISVAATDSWFSDCVLQCTPAFKAVVTAVNRLRFDGRSIVVRLRFDVDWQSNSSQIASNRSRISRIAVVATAWARQRVKTNSLGFDVLREGAIHPRIFNRRQFLPSGDNCRYCCYIWSPRATNCQDRSWFTHDARDTIDSVQLPATLQDRCEAIRFLWKKYAPISVIVRHCFETKLTLLHIH